MEHIKISLSLLLLLGLGLIRLQAQDAISATGSDALGNSGTVSYTLGQVVYTTNIGENASESQGVQQPFEISEVSGIEETNGTNLICSVYPNPAIQYLMLKIENYGKRKLSYQLYDLNGELLKNENIPGNEIFISMRNFIPSTYLLKVIDNNKEIKAFKIIKN